MACNLIQSGHWGFLKPIDYHEASVEVEEGVKDS